MHKNLFEIGSDFDDGWSSDNKTKPTQYTSCETKEPNQHQLHFVKEKRRGKIVTIVKPFYLKKNNIQQLLKGLKKTLGTGGTIKNNTLELQGDIPDKLRTQLEKIGYRFKE